MPLKLFTVIYINPLASVWMEYYLELPLPARPIKCSDPIFETKRLRPTRLKFIVRPPRKKPSVELLFFVVRYALRSLIFGESTDIEKMLMLIHFKWVIQHGNKRETRKNQWESTFISTRLHLYLVNITYYETDDKYKNKVTGDRDIVPSFQYCFS